MRVKSKKVEALVREAALNEFVQHGYRSASMRKIAAQANMTIGNLYCYYPSKMAMFSALVEGTEQEITRLIDIGADIVLQNQATNTEEMEANIVNAAEYIGEHRKNLLVLLEGSTGTPFENTKDNLSRVLSVHIEKMIVQFERHHDFKFDPEREFVVLLISNFLMDGFIQILKHYKNSNWVVKAIQDLVQLAFHGFLGFFKK